MFHPTFLNQQKSLFLNLKRTILCTIFHAVIAQVVIKVQKKRPSKPESMNKKDMFLIHQIDGLHTLSSAMLQPC